MSAGLETLLTQVHLSGAAAVLAAWLERAAQQELSYADFLQGLLEEEVAARSTAATQRRLREAAFPFAATIEQFDFRFRPDLKRQVVLRYLDPAFYEVIAGRYRRRPTIITSNKSLTDWAHIVQDVSLAAALVDRLMDGGQVFYLKGPSWRTKEQPHPGAAEGAVG